MDLSGTFKTEIYRPVVTIAIPGVVALAPYTFLLAKEFPHLLSLADNYQTLSTIVCVLSVIAVGFLLEDLGSFFEARFLERFHPDKDKLEREWYEYLRLTFVNEPIGCRYISTVVFRFKFELSFGMALIFAEIGCLIIKFTWVPEFPITALVIIPLICAYFFWESYSSSILLAKLRHELLSVAKDPNSPAT